MHNPTNWVVKGEDTHDVENYESFATRRGKRVTRPVTYLD